MNASMDLVIRRLKEQGVKFTRPRRAIVQRLLDSKGHLSADELLDALKKEGQSASRATIYRLIAILRKCGLIDAHDFDQRRKVFEPMVGRVHHDHLYCIGCGSIIEFSNDEIERLQDQVLKKHRFQMIYHSHKIFGYCLPCQRSGRL